MIRRSCSMILLIFGSRAPLAKLRNLEFEPKERTVMVCGRLRVMD
jgi:hypothetical protein